MKRMQLELHCSSCGNRHLFVEIMSHESHLVDSKLNYVHLLEAQVDHYRCHMCGQVAELVASESK